MTSTIPAINMEQARAILTEALAREMYESADGSLPQDEEIIMRDAVSLVEQASRAREIGNKSETVGAILFIAEVDQKPLPSDQQPAEQPVQTQDDNGQGSSVDVTKLSDDILDQMIIKLDSYVATPPVEAELQTLRAERERRKEAGGGQEQTQEGAAVGGDQGREEDQGATAAPADAGAQPAREAPAQSAEGSTDEAEQDAEVGGRAELEAQITLGMLGTHELTATGIADLSEDDLLYVIQHPQGPPLEEQEQQEVQEEPQQPQEAKTPQDAGLMESTISKEREALEEQITGPCLKAFGRGRVDIPGIGMNELRLMVEHPDGHVTKQQLEAARAADQGTPQQTFDPVAGEMTEPAEATQEEPEGDGFSPPSEEPAEPAQEEAPEPATALAETPSLEAQAPTPTQQPTQTRFEGTFKGPNRAQEIITRENWSEPAEIEGDPPVFPNDVSKVSDEDLFSYHARFHACLVRANWIISQEGDELHDLEKLLRSKEREVRRELPKTIDGKKLTKDDIEAEVQSNEEVKELVDRRDAVEQVISKLEVLRDNWRSDVSVCSRQFSFRKGEDERAPNR